MLASVPATEEAKDAVLIVQVPTVMEIDPKSAAAQAKVSYAGEPQFVPIEGTSLSYASNTQGKVPSGTPTEGQANVNGTVGL